MLNRLVLAVALLTTVAATAASAAAADRAAAGSCRVVADGPFLYVDIVIPDTAVVCDSAQRQLYVRAELTRDGAVVATATRRCRNASVCYLSVDASAIDVPGDQTWCVRATGAAGGAGLGDAFACESEAF